MGRLIDGAWADYASAALPGVRAKVTFEFMFRPEFLVVGSKVLFTEGKTKAIGTIRELLT
jgi:GTPase